MKEIKNGFDERDFNISRTRKLYVELGKVCFFPSLAYFAFLYCCICSRPTPRTRLDKKLSNAWTLASACSWCIDISVQPMIRSLRFESSPESVSKEVRELRPIGKKRRLIYLFKEASDKGSNWQRDTPRVAWLLDHRWLVNPWIEKTEERRCGQVLGSSACDAWTWWIVRKGVPVSASIYKVWQIDHQVKLSWKYIGWTPTGRGLLLIYSDLWETVRQIHIAMRIQAQPVQRVFSSKCSFVYRLSSWLHKTSRSRSCRDLAQFSGSSSGLRSSKATVHACWWTLLIGLFLFLLLQTVAGAPIVIQSSPIWKYQAAPGYDISYEMGSLD